jgi:anti-sigma regulatory factor (Ser/Thr protein kinase)
VSPIERPTTPRSAEDLPEQPSRLPEHVVGDRVLTEDALPQPDPRRRYSWPADARHANVIRDAVHRWLGTLPLSAHDVVSMVVAVDAAVENVIRHAYLDRAEGTGTVEIACWTEDGQVCAEVVDSGTWRAPRERVIGRGIALMKRLIDTVSVSSDEHGTRVLLSHPLSQALTTCRSAESDRTPSPAE